MTLIDSLIQYKSSTSSAKLSQDLEKVKQSSGVNVQVVQRAKSVPTKPVIVPTLLELVYKIYDTQRDIVNSINPIQTKMLTPVGISSIAKICCKNKEVYFDGIHASRAVNHFRLQGLKSGITDFEITPYICSNRIEIFMPDTFGGQPVARYDTIDGMKYMTISTNSAIINLLNSRAVLNNLSYMLNEEYNCNLHLTREALSIALENGYTNTAPAQRYLFNQAVRHYITPNSLSFHDFVRAQVFQTRALNDQAINNLYNDPETDRDIKRELFMADKIYNNKLANYFGYLGDHPDLVKD